MPRWQHKFSYVEIFTRYYQYSGRPLLKMFSEIFILGLCPLTIYTVGDMLKTVYIDTSVYIDRTVYFHIDRSVYLGKFLCQLVNIYKHTRKCTLCGIADNTVYTHVYFKHFL